MNEGLIILGSILTVIISLVTVAKFLFYTKSEINGKFAELKQESDKKDEILLEKVTNLHNELKEELIQTKDKIFEDLLNAERNNNKITQEIYDRLNQNKQIFDDYNKSMIEAMGQIKSDSHQISTDFSNILSAVKDELKSDYINRYNDLLKLINTKVNSSDFDRLESKFDKVTTTITELKTIVQLQMEERNKKS